MSKYVENKGYAVSGYRWVILTLFVLNVAITQIAWLTYAPIAKEAVVVYGVELQGIDLLSAVYMLTFAIFCFPASWCIERWGLKWGAGIGMVLIGVFTFLRTFAPDFTWLLIIQTLGGIGQPFVSNAVSKVVFNWFPQSEKSMALGLGAMGVFVGIFIAMFGTTMIYASFHGSDGSKGAINIVNIVYGIIALTGMIGHFIFVKDKPASPPNSIAAEEKFSMFKSFQHLKKNKDFLFLLCGFFFVEGCFNAIISKIDVILPEAISTETSVGILGGVICIGSILGAVILGAISDKYPQKRRSFLIGFMVAAVITSVSMVSFPTYTLSTLLHLLLGLELSPPFQSG